ncbi:MAG: hypothetical protein WAL91_01445, partial [Propionicimonas sp.]
LHSCAPWPGAHGWPLSSLLSGDPTSAGFGAISLDLDQLGAADWDPLATAVDAGAGFYLGCLPTASEPRTLPVDAVRVRVLRALERIGVDGPSDRVVLTPACGLAGWTTAEAGRAFQVLRAAGEQVTNELGG